MVRRDVLGAYEHDLAGNAYLLFEEENLKDLSPRQTETLEAINAFWLAHHYPPSIAELADPLGVVRGTITERLVALEKKGMIIREPNVDRSLRLSIAGKEFLLKNS